MIKQHYSQRSSSFNASQQARMREMIKQSSQFIGQQAVDNKGKALGTITDAYMEDNQLMIVVNNDREIPSYGVSQIDVQAYLVERIQR